MDNNNKIRKISAFFFFNHFYTRVVNSNREAIDT